MTEDWLKSNRNYVLAWVITLALFVFAVRVNVWVRVPAGFTNEVQRVK